MDNTDGHSGMGWGFWFGKVEGVLGIIGDRDPQLTVDEVAALVRLEQEVAAALRWTKKARGNGTEAHALERWQERMEEALGELNRSRDK